MCAMATHENQSTTLGNQFSPSAVQMLGIASVCWAHTLTHLAILPAASGPAFLQAAPLPHQSLEGSHCFRE